MLNFQISKMLENLNYLVSRIFLILKLGPTSPITKTFVQKQIVTNYLCKCFNKFDKFEIQILFCMLCLIFKQNHDVQLHFIVLTLIIKNEVET